MVRRLLDTSVVIADWGSSGLGTVEEAAISVITLGELRAGVALAREPARRAARQARLTALRRAFDPLPVDEAVAEHYGDVLAAARGAGRGTRATDLLIVATAAATGRALHTLDAAQARLAAAVGVVVHGDLAGALAAAPQPEAAPFAWTARDLGAPRVELEDEEALSAVLDERS